MRFIGTQTNEYLTTPGDRDAHLLVRVSCRDRATGAINPLGLWTGVQSRAFVIGGVTETYFGGSAIVAIPQITRSAGLDVRLHSLTLSRQHSAVRELLEVRDIRHARIEIFRALFAPETGQLVAEPHLEFDGFVDTLDGAHGLGKPDEVGLKFSTFLHLLTRSLPLNYSLASSQRAGDEILKYAAISGQHQVYWGEKRHDDPAAGVFQRLGK